MGYHASEFLVRSEPPVLAVYLIDRFYRWIIWSTPISISELLDGVTKEWVQPAFRSRNLLMLDSEVGDQPHRLLRENC